jgi:small GTP-binding protein
MSVVSKINDIEAEIARTQINKQTMSHLCLLRARLAKYKRELLEPSKGAGGGGAGEGFDVRATGDARVGFVGFPSVGKSTLLTSLTDVYSEAASYEFTTLTCVPGVKFWRGAKIQLLDLPGIIEGAKDGKGRGKQVIGVARTCSCIIIVLDAMKPLGHKKIIEAELEGVGIRLNKQPPKITVKKKDKGGFNISSSQKLTHLDDESIAAILKEYKMGSADVRINCDPTACATARGLGPPLHEAPARPSTPLHPLAPWPRDGTVGASSGALLMGAVIEPRPGSSARIAPRARASYWPTPASLCAGRWKSRLACSHTPQLHPRPSFL